MTRALGIAVLVATLALAATAVAAIRPRPTITPATPYVDQTIEVRFTAPRTLRSGETYQVTILGCSVAAKRVGRPRKAGERITVRLRPSDQVQGGRTWCAGSAGAFIDQMKGEKRLRAVASKTFRFRARG